MTKSISLQVKALLKKNFLCAYRSKELRSEIVLPLVAAAFVSLKDQITQLTFLAPLFLAIAINSSARSLLIHLVEEKEGRFKETQKIMGLRQRSYLSGWLIFGYTKTLFSAIFLLIFWSIMARIISSGNFGITTSFWDFVGCYIIYTIASLNQALMISSMFYSSKLAGEVTTFVTIVFQLLTFLLFVEKLQDSKVFYVLLSIFPNSCISFGYISILKQSQTQLFPDIGGTYNLNDTKIQLTIEAIIYFILYFYLDQVFPNEYGVSKKPLFFIEEFFQKKKNLKVSTVDEPFLNSESEMGDMSSAIYHQKINFNKQVTIEIRNLVKKFGDFTAVNKLSINLYENEILCLLGHNGAGKTTTISMLTGLLDKTSGKVQILNLDINTQLDSIRELIGICNQRDVLYDDLTVYEQLQFMGQIKGLSGFDLDQDIEQILFTTELTEDSQKITRDLSGGNKRKLSLAMALIGGSQVIFLDEPTSGMDAMSRRVIWKILEKVKQDGRTLVLTTHHLDEAEILADRIAIMAAGKLLACGSSDFIKENFGEGYQLSITILNSKIDKQKLSQDIQNQLQFATPDSQSSVNTILYQVPFKAKPYLGKFFQYLEKYYGQSINVNLKMNSLEDAFVNIGMDEEKFIQKANRQKDNIQGDDISDISGESHNISIENQKQLRVPDCLKEPPKYIFKQQFIAVVQRKWYNTIRAFSNYIATIIPFLLIIIGTIIINQISFLDESYGPNYEQANIQIKQIFICVFVIIAFCFNSSIFITLPVLEREYNLKYALNVMGCRELPYWIGTFAFDYSLYSIFVIVFVIFSYALQLDFVTQSIGKVVFAFITLGLSLIPFAYVIGLLFYQKTSKAMKTFPIFNFFIVYCMPFNIWGILNLIRQNVGGSSDNNDTLAVIIKIWMWISTLSSPYYTFTYAFGTIIPNTLDDSRPNKSIEISRSSYLFSSMLIVQFVLYSVLTIVIERYKFQQNKQFTQQNEKMDYRKSIRVDNGVQQEKQRINEEQNNDKIITSNLQKYYDNGFLAIKDVSFGIGQSEILGLLGPNGAGKSTMFNTLTTYIPKSSGNIKIMNRELSRNEPEIFKNVGICPQFDCIWENLTPVEHLYLFGRMKGLSGRDLDESVEFFISTMQLDEYINRKAGQLSGGNKRKLCVSNALIGGPCIQFFDEPSTGVDPIARRFLWKTLKLGVQLRQSSVVITTHTMDEAESLCDRIAILVNGQLYCIGTTQELRDKYGEGYNISMKIEGQINSDQILQIINEQFKGVKQIEDQREGFFTVHVSNQQFNFYRMYELMDGKLKQNGLIEDFSINQASLETVFLYFSKQQQIPQETDNFLTAKEY